MLLVALVCMMPTTLSLYPRTNQNVPNRFLKGRCGELIHELPCRFAVRPKSWKQRGKLPLSGGTWMVPRFHESSCVCLSTSATRTLDARGAENLLARQQSRVFLLRKSQVTQSTSSTSAVRRSAKRGKPCSRSSASVQAFPIPIHACTGATRPPGAKDMPDLFLCRKSLHPS